MSVSWLLPCDTIVNERAVLSCPTFDFFLELFDFCDCPLVDNAFVIGWVAQFGGVAGPLPDVVGFDFFLRYSCGTNVAGLGCIN